MKIPAMVTAALALSTVPITAQNYLREAISIQKPVSERIETAMEVYLNQVGWLKVPINFSQSASQAQFVLNTGSSSKVSLPFHRAGDVTKISDAEYLLGGLKYSSWSPATTRGVLCLVECRKNSSGQPVLKVLATEHYTSFDPTGLVYHKGEKRLYVLDYKGRRVLSALWQGGDLPKEQTFETAASHAEIPDLKAPLLCELEHVADEDDDELMEDPEPIPEFEPEPDPIPEPAPEPSIEPHGADPDTGVLLVSPNHWNPLRIFKTGTRWTKAWNKQTLKSGGPSFLWTKDQAWFGGGCAFLVNKEGAGSGSFEIIEKITGASLGSWNIAKPGGAVTVGPLAYVNSYPGLTYTLRPRNPEAFPIDLVGSVRYGRPSGNSYIDVSRGLLPDIRPQIGSDIFGAGVAVSPGASASKSQETIHGAVLFGYRDTRGQDPVVVNGDVAVLNPTGVLDFSFVAGDMNASYGHRFALPRDPDLEGVVLLFQYVFVTPGGGVAFSDVFGQVVGAGRQSMNNAALLGVEAIGGKMVIKRGKSASRWKTSPTGSRSAALLRTTWQLLDPNSSKTWKSAKSALKTARTKG
ncbi:MAG: hypothetical protein CSA62_01575 [Planctomycetota bacterium]|nr:MAG: hypothetical protein CSA62_01575 [Planctomycetota bacterium]